MCELLRMIRGIDLYNIIIYNPSTQRIGCITLNDQLDSSSLNFLRPKTEELPHFTIFDEQASIDDSNVMYTANVYSKGTLIIQLISEFQTNPLNNLPSDSFIKRFPRVCFPMSCVLSI